MKNKKNQNLAALLSDDSGNIEQQVTGRGQDNSTNKAPAKPNKAIEETIEETGAGDTDLQREALEEPKMTLEDELGLPKSFTRMFKKNSRYEKESKTTTLVYRLVLEKYSKVASAMDVDTVVLVNNVLAEWYNKHLEPFDKVVNRKEPVKAL